MGNAFTNFLSGVGKGIFGEQAQPRDYQHADRLYVRNTYARNPKVAFLYYVVFNINQEAIRDPSWKSRDVGFLVKKTDLPKFTLTTETLNQYNRRTVVQTGIKYSNVSMEFHDDNSNISRDLWTNYFKYYYADSTYGDNAVTKLPAGVPPQYSDTKYGTNDYKYGYNNSLSPFRSSTENATAPFFQSIDIYVLHQQRFSQYTLVNPKISDWSHDNVDQNEGSRVLSNKMTIAYETVLYNQGKIQRGKEPAGFASVYYDTTPSPLSIGGNGRNKLLGPGGVIAGADSIFGLLGKENKSPLDYLNIAIQGNNLRKNIGQINKNSLKNEGYSVIAGVLGNVQATGNQPGGVGEAVRVGLSQAGINSSGKLGINLFSGNNSSINNSTPTTPSKLTGGGP
jgi:hypothetical protein